MLPTEINLLFEDEGEMRYAIRRYCVGCIAHRLIKFGWEPEVNTLGPRMMILLCMYLPLHARMPVLLEAWQRAINVADELSLKMLEKAFGLERVA